jgi:cell division septal protein FtsQ
MTLHLQQRQDHLRSRRERRKSAKRARIRRQVVRYFFLCLLLAGAAGGFLLLPWSIADAERDIVVQGNQVVDVDQVRGALLSCVGKPIFKLDPKLLEARVKSLEAVRYAYVRRYIIPRPHLVVQVLEEFPWATLYTSPDTPPVAVISETGRVIPLSQFPNVIQPEFKIYGPSGLTMNKTEVSQWAAWVAYIAAQTGKKVDSIDMRQPQNLWIADGDLRLKIGVADSTLTRRLGRLASVVPVLEKVNGQLDYIDLGLDNNIPLKVVKADPHHPGATQNSI